MTNPANLKRVTRAWARSPHTSLRRLSAAISTAANLLRSVTNPRLRSELLTRLQQRDAHFQGSTFTQPDRYPLLFQQARESLAHLPSPRLLSFGCSTGEEAQTLARYLPAATIVGVDINRWCLAQSRRHNTNPNLTFHHRNDPAFTTQPTFDAIFCLAVFQRTENREANRADHNNTTGFTFTHFAQEIALLDQKLNPGGLFFIDQADFRFEDTPTASAYDPLPPKPTHDRLRRRPLFGPDNHLIAHEYTPQRIFRKHP